jgi:DUF438 domain-containing protein
MTESWQDLLKLDHETTEKVFAAMEKPFTSPAGPPPALVAKFFDYVSNYVDRCHNQKEEQHLFPLVEQRGIPRQSGPLSIMLLEHEAARGLLAKLEPLVQAYAAGDVTKLEALRATFGEYVALCKDHYWKENDVLFPMAARAMSEADGAAVVRGIEQVEAALGANTRADYYRLARELIQAGGLKDLSFGVEGDVLAAILNTLPVELSFVDQDDTVRYFSHEQSEKIFPRTRGVIGAKVQNCHPHKSVHVVNQILADFKAGKREVAEFWLELGPRFLHIRYWPVRDPGGRYLGCLETVQDVTSIRALTGKKTLLDQG